VAGTYGMQEGVDLHTEHGEPESYTWEEFRPLFFSEPPRIILIPDRVPSEIAQDLTNSFQLYWVDPESCANRIRSSVERLLSHFGVRRTAISKKGKRVLLSLHSRIEVFRANHAGTGDALMAVRWIGNAGSHTQPITREDLLDGYELMEHVLAELFAGRHRRIAQLSRQINRRKRPRSVGRRRT
jgi:hypothetical protein